MASLLALLLAGTAACGNVEDSAPQPVDESASSMSGSCTTIDHTVNIDNAYDLKQFKDLGCFTVEGHLFVQETDDIKDLDALSGLRSVSGYIGIADNIKLEKVKLPNLEETGEGLVVEGNHKLESISFPKLEEVGGYLHVFNNQRLEKASFQCLEKVGDDVIFAGVDKLTKLELPCLKKVDGTFIFEHSDKLEYLCLPQLKYVEKNFLVHFNRDLKAVLAPNLEYVGKMLEFQRNPHLVKVKMKDLDKVKGDVKIVYNHKWSECKVYDLVKDIDYIGGQKTIHSNYEKCRSVSIYPPKWCSSDACKKCKCKDDVYCEEPGDDDDDDDDGHGDDDDDDDGYGDDDDDDDGHGDDDDDDDDGHGDDDDDDDGYGDDDDDDDGHGDDDDDDDGYGDDDDDDELSCQDKCLKKAKKVCKPLKGWGYKYKKCVKSTYSACTDRYCDGYGDDDDDDDGDEMCEDRCKEKAKKVCKIFKWSKHKYKKCFNAAYDACTDRYCEVAGDDDDDDDGNEACTPGYWKNHHGAWCDTYDADTKLKYIFSTPWFVDGRDKLSEALRYRGGSGLQGAARILLRHAVASLLNACTVDYPLTKGEVIDKVNDALESKSRQKMLHVAGYLDDINNDNMCPLSGGPSMR